MSTVVALYGTNQLAYFNDAAPGTVLAKVKVKGTARGESLVGVDFRPADQKFYGVGDSGRLYRIDPASGRATAVGNQPFDVVLSGVEFGVDFNPAVDRLRIVSDADQNLRVNPDTGLVVDADPAVAGVQGDLALAYATGDVAAGANPAVVASAYNSNVAGTPTSTLYGIDSDRDTLVIQGSPGGAPTSPNTGTLTTVGALGVDTRPEVGFDITTLGGTDLALASLSTNARGRSGLYTVNLTTGAATLIGEIAAGRRPVRDIAVAPEQHGVVGVDTSGRLIAFDTALPNVLLLRTKVTGLARREKIVGIDQRPSNGAVYALTNQGRLYTLNPNGAATAVAGGAQAEAPLGAGDFGIDFNPVPDRLRVVNDAGQNFRLNADTVALEDNDTAAPGNQPDGNLVFATADNNNGLAPHVTGAAYSNNVAGATTTTLYDIDTKLDALVTQGSVGGTPTSPNTGQLFTVGPLGVNASDLLGFDIFTQASTDLALAALKARGRQGIGLYSINLTTGAATLLGNIGTRSSPLVGMTVVG